VTTIRPELRSDFDVVRAINDEAFGQPLEGRIIDAIRDACPEVVSLVAVEDQGVVGHIFFSPVTIATEDGLVEGMGLGPMAVLPSRQRCGTGSQLIRAGLEILRAQECPFVVVLGHTEYYPKFGFVPAIDHRLTCQWDGIPEDVFMALPLDASVMKGVSGIARYRPEFNEAV